MDLKSIGAGTRGPRSLATSTINATNASGVLENPLVCLKLQDSLLFDLPTDPPEAVKDSLFDTNDNLMTLPSEH
jgi:hypothetical protein